MQVLNFGQHLTSPKRDSSTNFFICIKKMECVSVLWEDEVRASHEHSWARATESHTNAVMYTHTLSSVPLKA